MTLMLLLVSYLTIGVLLLFFGIEIVKSSLTDFEFIIVLITYPILIIIVFAQIKFNSSVISINFSNNTVTFRNYFTRCERVHLLNEFEGYIDTFVKSPNGDFRVLYLRDKNKMLKHKISGRFYSNLKEIEQGLNQLKYLGFHKFSLKWSLYVFFNKKVPECKRNSGPKHTTGNK